MEKYCVNCGKKFHPWGGQMFCSEKCRYIYYEQMKPLGKREKARIEASKEFKTQYIDTALPNELQFDFKLCGKCGNIFAVYTNKLFIQKINCPFCKSDAMYATSLNDKYICKGVDE